VSPVKPIFVSVNMFGLSKLSRIVLLMSVSGILLILFISRWLQSEYESEKMTLQKDLFDEFISARSRMTDSLIAKNLIDPILSNPAGFKLSGIDEADFENDTIHVITTDVIGTTMTENYVGKNNLPAPANIEMRIESDSTDVLYQGVKLFISKVSGANGEAEFFEKFISPGDTVMMKTFYAENLKKNHFDVVPVWVTNKTGKKFPPPPFYYESHFFDFPYGVQIENFNALLIKKITPQIAFALLLVLIITTAFIFSYRSLRSQIRLAGLKDDLISNISHELKTPVATVKVAIEAMQEMDPVEKKEKLKDYLGMASQEIARLDMLVNKVMNSILLDNGRQVFQAETINLTNLVNETIDSMQVQLQQKNAMIGFLSDADEINVFADRLHLKGVLYNLLDNGIKYGGEAPVIVVRLKQADSHVILECSDNGPGIPEAYLQKVFEKFFRVPKGNDHTTKGYGLGLYYAKQVMQESGGTIEVKNNADAGCTFTLQFPAV